MNLTSDNRMISQRFIQKIKELRREIDAALTDFPLAGIPERLYEPVRYALTAPGKRIRPILVLLFGEALGVPQSRLLQQAIAVELLHTFTLVHDDIMDQDTHRRGCQTIHVKWNQSTAILVGDALMALAFHVIAETESPQNQAMSVCFAEAMLEICEGQSLDLAFEQLDDVSQDAYLDMVARKTGRLLALCAELAGLSAGADEQLLQQLYHFGVEIGQAFQIQDDLLEIVSSREKMGKSLDSDLATGKKTYPLIEALSDLNPIERQDFIQYLQHHINQRPQIVGAFEARGSLQRSRALIDRLLDQALSRLQALPRGAGQQLQMFVEFLKARQS